MHPGRSRDGRSRDDKVPSSAIMPGFLWKNGDAMIRRAGISRRGILKLMGGFAATQALQSISLNRLSFCANLQAQSARMQGMPLTDDYLERVLRGRARQVDRCLPRSASRRLALPRYHRATRRNHVLRQRAHEPAAGCHRRRHLRHFRLPARTGGLRLSPRLVAGADRSDVAQLT